MFKNPTQPKSAKENDTLFGKKQMIKPKSELSEQTSIVKWFYLQYPNEIINCSLSGTNLHIITASLMKKAGNKNAFPDLCIPVPKGNYHGLYIELKRTGEKVLNKDGNPKTEHIKEQLEVLKYLSNKGYLAKMVIGKDEAIRIIKSYMAL